MDNNIVIAAAARTAVGANRTPTRGFASSSWPPLPRFPSATSHIVTSMTTPIASGWSVGLGCRYPYCDPGPKVVVPMQEKDDPEAASYGVVIC